MPPAKRRVVVVCSRIYDRIWNIIMRQVAILRVTGKCVLKDAHPRKTESVAKLLDFARHHAEVLGNDGQSAQRAFNRAEKFTARHVYPLTFLGCLVTAGHFPRSDKPAKMIDADDISQLKCLPKSPDPPAKAVTLHCVPVVDRVAPELTCF